jgi:hypothetical protein
MKLYVYYRISDMGRPKEKLPAAGKLSCLKNTINEFGAENIYVIADNCLPETIDFIRENNLTFEETKLGNSTSFLFMIGNIIKKHQPNDFVYLLEDDYIHLPGSKAVLLEGLEIGDYVTLYDHPDKYWLESERGSPFNYRKLQKTRIFVTPNAHWRETNSATMTFACKVSTLQNDYQIWKKYATGKKIPDDFHAFMEITQNSFFYLVSFFLRRRKNEFFILLTNFILHKKIKRLLSVLPSYATHGEVEWLAPVVKWNKIENEY